MSPQPETVDGQKEANEVLQKARDTFHRKIKNPMHMKRRFITEDVIKSVVTDSVINTLVKGCHEFSPLGQELVKLVCEKFSKIVAILIWIGWNDWGRFEDLFCRKQGRMDEDLPFNWDDPRRSFLLDEHFEDTDSPTEFARVWNAVRRFNDEQFIFLPIVIAQGEVLDYSNLPKSRLPFIDQGTYLGAGEFGTVKKEVIACRQFRDGDKLSADEFSVASKLIKSKSIPRATCSVCDQVCTSCRPNNQKTHDGFLSPGSNRNPSRSASQISRPKEKESETLQQLRNSLLSHDRLMRNLGALKHGTDFYIFYSIADMDLEQFLSGNYESFDISAFGEHRIHAIEQTRGVAGALVHLHSNSMEDRNGNSIVCYHMDLKPANILVQGFGPSFPVGKWMISDFGLSNIMRITEDKKTGKLRTEEEKMTSLTDIADQHSSGVVTEARKAAPCARVFQQPELSDKVPLHLRYMRGDVWSFGCIFSIILTYLLGGVDMVHEFESVRSLDLPNSTQTYTTQETLSNCGSAQGGEAFHRNGKLTEEVKRWLKRLRQTYQWEWVDVSVEFILVTLANRPPEDSKFLKDGLKEIEGILRNNFIRNQPSNKPPLHPHSRSPAILVHRAATLPNPPGENSPTPVHREDSYIASSQDSGQRNASNKILSPQRKDSGSLSFLAETSHILGLPEQDQPLEIDTAQANREIFGLSQQEIFTDQRETDRITNLPQGARESQASSPPEWNQSINLRNPHKPGSLDTSHPQDKILYSIGETSNLPSGSERRVSQTTAHSTLQGNIPGLFTPTISSSPGKIPNSVTTPSPTESNDTFFSESLFGSEQGLVINMNPGGSSPHRLSSTPSHHSGTSLSTSLSSRDTQSSRTTAIQEALRTFTPFRAENAIIKSTKFEAKNVVWTSICPTGGGVAFVTKKGVTIYRKDLIDREISDRKCNSTGCSIISEGFGWDGAILRKDKILVYKKNSKPRVWKVGVGIIQDPNLSEIRLQMVDTITNVEQGLMLLDGLLIFQKKTTILTGYGTSEKKNLTALPSPCNLEIQTVSTSSGGETIVALVGTMDHMGWRCWKRVANVTWELSSGNFNNNCKIPSDPLIFSFYPYDGFLGIPRLGGGAAFILTKAGEDYERRDIPELDHSVSRVHITPNKNAIVAIINKIWPSKPEVKVAELNPLDKGLACGSATNLSGVRSSQNIHEAEDSVIVESEAGDQVLLIAYTNGIVERVFFQANPPQ